MAGVSAGAAAGGLAEAIKSAKKTAQQQYSSSSDVKEEQKKRKNTEVTAKANVKRKYSNYSEEDDDSNSDDDDKGAQLRLKRMEQKRKAAAESEVEKDTKEWIPDPSSSDPHIKKGDISPELAQKLHAAGLVVTRRVRYCTCKTVFARVRSSNDCPICIERCLVCHQTINDVDGQRLGFNNEDGTSYELCETCAT